MAGLIKDPIEVLDIVLKWQKPLKDGDEIDTSTWEVEGSGLTLTGSKTSVETRLWLSAGTDGTIYRLRNVVTTVLGRTLVYALPPIHVKQKR